MIEWEKDMEWKKDIIEWKNDMIEYKTMHKIYTPLTYLLRSCSSSCSATFVVVVIAAGVAEAAFPFPLLFPFRAWMDIVFAAVMFAFVVASFWRAWCIAGEMAMLETEMGMQISCD